MERLKQWKYQLWLWSNGIDLSEDDGSQTAEYAVVALAAAAFAGMLLAIFRSGTLKGMLLEVIQKALGA